MGIYSKYIFPTLMDRVMSGGQMSKVRARLLAGVAGDVFEIGFGTGLNLPHYPSHVTRITTADPNDGMSRIARRRAEKSGIDVNHHTVSGEQLPFDDASFDAVVCTWTLCSIPDAHRALAEIYRVLRPSGTFYFVEHGLADSPGVQRWQHRLTPLQRIVSDGCHFNRDVRALIHSQDFVVQKLENFYLPRTPRFAGYLYQGVALKPA